MARGGSVRSLVAASCAAITLALTGGAAGAASGDVLDASATSSGIGGQGMAAGHQLAQTFTAVGSGRISRVDLQLSRYSSGGPTVVQTALATVDGAGRPDRVLAASATVPYSSISGSTHDTVSFAYASDAATIEAGNRYAIVLYLGGGSGCCLAANRTHGYAGGQLWTNYGGSWNLEGSYGGGVTDLVFSVYRGVQVTDTDGDGVDDANDAFPNDPTETIDTDGDGVGDNGDVLPNDPNIGAITLSAASLSGLVTEWVSDESTSRTLAKHLGQTEKLAGRGDASSAQVRSFLRKLDTAEGTSIAASHAETLRQLVALWQA